MIGLWAYIIYIYIYIKNEATATIKLYPVYSPYLGTTRNPYKQVAATVSFPF